MCSHNGCYFSFSALKQIRTALVHPRKLRMTKVKVGVARQNISSAQARHSPSQKSWLLLLSATLQKHGHELLMSADPKLLQNCSLVTRPVNDSRLTSKLHMLITIAQIGGCGQPKHLPVLPSHPLPAALPVTLLLCSPTCHHSLRTGLNSHSRLLG